MTFESERTVVHGVPGFWERVEAARERFLILDYDGTLAPFKVNRMDALPIDGVIDALAAIRDSGRTRLAIVTGRPLQELLELTGDLEIPLVGSHGFESLEPGGSVRCMDLSPDQSERFARAEVEARRVADTARVERKRASVGLHTRGMSTQDARDLHEAVWNAWSCDSSEHGLECRRFSGGVELRLKGIHKGTAVRMLLEGTGADTLSVYVGDDDTDEDAFRALPDNGVGIKVGPPGVETLATGRLDDSLAVREFLETWAEMMVE